MNIETEFDTDLTIQSFAYVASQLAQSPTAHKGPALYEQILGEAEKHRSALRLEQRDVLEAAQDGARKQLLTKAQYQSLRNAVIHKMAQAEQAIARIAAQYAPHKLAAQRQKPKSQPNAHLSPFSNALMNPAFQ